MDREKILKASRKKKTNIRETNFGRKNMVLRLLSQYIGQYLNLGGGIFPIEFHTQAPTGAHKNLKKNNHLKKFCPGSKSESRKSGKRVWCFFVVQDGWINGG